MKDNTKGFSNQKLLPKIRNKIFSDLPQTHTLNRRNTVASNQISKKIAIIKYSNNTNNNNQIKKRKNSKKTNNSFRVLNSAFSSKQCCSSDKKFSKKNSDKKRINRPLTRIFDQKVQNKKVENEKVDFVNNAILTTNCTDIPEEKNSNNNKNRKRKGKIGIRKIRK